MSDKTWNSGSKPWTPFDIWSDLGVGNLHPTDVVMDKTAVAGTEATHAAVGSLDVARQLSDDWFSTLRASTDFMGAMVGAARERGPAKGGSGRDR